MLFNHAATDLEGMIKDFDAQGFSVISAVAAWPQKDLYASADP
jgi:hypothetical protein